MRNLFEAFVRERRYGKGVSERTEDWYWRSWKIFAPAFESATTETLSKEAFVRVIEPISKRGVSATTINTYARAINAFLRWLHTEEISPKLLRIPRLKEKEPVIATYKPEHVQRLLSYRPNQAKYRRAQLMALVVIDTGMRIKELLSLTREDVDLDNLLMTIRDGKGGKQRVVPFTTELRRHLFKHVLRNVKQGQLVFRARNGARLNQDNARRDFGEVRAHLRITGVKGGFHVLRHTFALNYIRNGGDVFRLQRILGHSTLDMTRRYVNLQTEDLQAVHDRLSLLTRR